MRRIWGREHDFSDYENQGKSKIEVRDTTKEGEQIHGQRY